MREIPIIRLDVNKPDTFGNVAERLDEDERGVLAGDLIDLIGIDDQSMSEWAGRAQGYLNDIEDQDDGSSATKYGEQQGTGEEAPPVTEMTLSAVIQFSARATDALLGEPDLARASEPGSEKLAAWVSSQLRTKDKNWVLDTDPLIVHMSVTGLAWRKRDFDDDEKVFHSHFVPSVGTNSVIINSNVRSIDRAARITHQFERYPYEIQRSIQRKKWIDYDPNFDEQDPQAPQKFYEIDLWLDLDGDDIDEPWTITISRDDTPQVVRIRPRWSKKTVVDNDNELFFNPIHRFYPYRFLPDPKGGFFPMGFGKLLDRTQNAANQLLGAIVDTAKSESENGGIIGGSKFGVPDSIEIKNNRMTTIPTDGMSLDKLMQMWPQKSVSPGSVAMLEKMITLGDRLSGTLNTLENAPASMTATLAKGLIDNGQQIQSAVHRRMCASLTQEIMMFVLMGDAYGQLPDDVSASDKDGVGVTADPQLATEMQRTAQAGIYKELLEVPGVFVPQEVGLRLVKVLRLPDPEKLVAPPQEPQATPKEKMDGIIALFKQKIEEKKVTAQVAVQLTQALKNLVDASGGMLDNRAALLNMAQLEQAVQTLMGDASAGSQPNGMAGPSGNPGAAGLPAPPQDDGSSGLSGGSAGPPGSAGPSGPVQ